MQDQKVDWEDLRDGLEASIKGQLDALLEGGVATIDGPIREAANRMAVAVRRGRKEVAAEAADQIALAIKAQGLKARSMSGALDVALGIGVNFLFDGALAGINAIVSRR